MSCAAFRGFLAGDVVEELFGGRERLSAALDAACGLSHLHNMTPRQPVGEGSENPSANYISCMGICVACRF